MRDHISTDYAAVVNSIPNYFGTNQKKWTTRTKHKRGSKGHSAHHRPVPKGKTWQANSKYLLPAQILELLYPGHYWDLLDSNATKSEVGPHGFSVLRTDQDPSITRKTDGGRVCLLIWDKWCRTVVVREAAHPWLWAAVCLSTTLLFAKGVPSDLFYYYF